MEDTITIKDVCALTSATDAFLIPANKNIYDIEFTRFILRNMENNQKLIDVGQPKDKRLPAKDPDEARFETVQKPCILALTERDHLVFPVSLPANQCSVFTQVRLVTRWKRYLEHGVVSYPKDIMYHYFESKKCGIILEKTF